MDGEGEGARDGGSSANLVMDGVGEVVVSLNSSGLSWTPIDPSEESKSSTCLGVNFSSKAETGIEFSHVYAVEFIHWGLVHKRSSAPGGFVLGDASMMYRFVVHGYQKSRTRHSLWVLASYTFGHEDLQACHAWVDCISASIGLDVGRPKNLMVFVHPLSGNGRGRKIWDSVAPLFARARVRTKVTVTQRAGHAFDVVASIPDKELSSFDGIVVVGGDGFFNEILNGLLLSRHVAPYPPVPGELIKNADQCTGERGFNKSNNNGASGPSCEKEEHSPLISSVESNFRMEAGSCNPDKNPAFSFPNDWFRIGIIPAGSTDSIVMSTTGSRDPITSALHIILGKRKHMDIAQVVRWKTSASSIEAPLVRYAASFTGYGFYGDVIKESEKYRWMGPKRYDYAGTKVFLKHRSYEAEVAFLDVKTEDTSTGRGPVVNETQPTLVPAESPKKAICRKICDVCCEVTKSTDMSASHAPTNNGINVGNLKWLRSKGRYLSVGAAIISCRNERAPDGLVADAHLTDGFMHLILIKECPRAFYLWHLTQLAKKGADPLKFEFVEHYKTTAFTFVASSDESVWNVDGELLYARQLSAQVFRGLICLFATGPEI
ncbi:Sphingosine kinase 1 [Acorus calamus]|uniref:Sphingosine kinase 1 n=1 Tax=Acorus calamus TaxID=4465 RepID=A0AAV9DX75_ACOCL|nr:Sphingosine kinase 1 [Acorus calamus]